MAKHTYGHGYQRLNLAHPARQEGQELQAAAVFRILAPEGSRLLAAGSAMVTHTAQSPPHLPGSPRDVHSST